MFERVRAWNIRFIRENSFLVEKKQRQTIVYSNVQYFIYLKFFSSNIQDTRVFEHIEL